MLNQTVIVGRIVNEPVLKETENGRKETTLTIAVPRNYKNVDGEYETDFLDCVVQGNIGETCVDYCGKGDLVGIKGHLNSKKVIEGNIEKNNIILVGEKVTFLTMKKESKETNFDELEK